MYMLYCESIHAVNIIGPWDVKYVLGLTRFTKGYVYLYHKCINERIRFVVHHGCRKNCYLCKH